MTNNNHQSDRPDPLEVQANEVPTTLQERDQWVCWRYVWEEDREEWTKIPINTSTGYNASTRNPETWTTFEGAVEYHKQQHTDTDGIGFVVTEDDPIVGIDLDYCRDPETQQQQPWADEVISELSSYVEISPSGTGIRLFLRGTIPSGGTRGDVPNSEGHIEMYEDGRYLTVTGHTLDATRDEPRQADDAIADLHDVYISDDTPEMDLCTNPDIDDNSPNIEIEPPDEDLGELQRHEERLLQKATEAKNSKKFTRLWKGDETLWEGKNSEYPSQSEADAALCEFFVYWSDKLYNEIEPKLIDRLFRHSGLMRSKWDEVHYQNGNTYGDGTIDTAIQHFESDTSKDTLTNVSSKIDNLVEEPEFTALEHHVDNINSLPLPYDVATKMGYDGPKALKGVSKAECAHYAWELLRPHLDLCLSLPDETLYACNDGVWKPNGKQVLREAGRRTLGPYYAKSVLKELTEQVATTSTIHRDEMGVSAGKLPVQNGLLDLQKAADGSGKGAIRALEPDDYAIRRLPVSFDPEVSYEEWHNNVEEWAETGMADALQEFVGYCLHLGEMPIHRALLLVGSGANGKSVFLNVVESLLGDDNTSSIELQTLANEQNARADFYGSLANIDDDLSARKLGSGLGMFKKLVAGDTVRARQLYKQGFEFPATGKHLYAANQVPDVSETVGDDDEAFWRRWLLIEFPQYYPPNERDPKLADKFTTPQSLSGVLNWAIEGWSRLIEQGKFTNESSYAIDKRQRWQAWGDSVDKFIAVCVESDPAAPNKTTGEVYNRYTEWSRENGEEPVGQQQFTNTLKQEDVGYATSVRVDGTPQRGYKKLRLSDDTSESG